MIGFEENDISGEFGTSSYGDTRIYRLIHKNSKHTEQMKLTYPLWELIEREAGLITPDSKLL